MGSCRVKGCKSNSGRRDFKKPVRFFKFPKDAALCQRWISLCGREINNLNTATICSLHFKDEDYSLKDRLLNTPTEKRHLNEEAVPSLYLSDCVQILKDREENASKSLRKKIVEEVLQNSGVKEETVVKKRRCYEAKINNIQKLHPICNKPVESTTTGNLRAFRNQTIKIRKEDEEKVDNDDLNKKIEEMQSEIESLKTSVSSFKQMEKSLSNIFTQGQIQKMKNPEKNINWSFDDVVSASGLRSTEPQAYKYLRNKEIPFPRTSTLKRWAMKIESDPGILADFIKVMQTWKLRAEQKICSLCFGKMRIKSKLNNDNIKYVRKSQYVQVVMARGLFKSWNQPIFYAYDCKMTKNILEIIISELYKIGFHVVAIVSNMDPSNHNLWKELQIGLMKTWFYHPDDSKMRIFVFIDAPCLLKQIRNHFIDTGFIINGKLLNSGPLKKLLASMTLSYSDMNTTHTIKETQNVQKVQKPKVKRPTQLFSNTVCSSLERCIKVKNGATVEVANFVKLVNDWFNVINTNILAADVHGVTKAFGVDHEEQMKILNKMDDTILNLTIPSQTSLPPFQKGILILNCSLRGISKYIQNKYDTRFVLARRFNHDDLENFFESVRFKGHQPTKLEFQYRLWSHFST